MICRIILLILLLHLKVVLFGQIIYSQNFNTPTTLASSGWTNTNLTTPWSSSTYLYLGFFPVANVWQVSDYESGRPPNTCGAAGMGNQSLYIGADGIFSSVGAAYISNASTNRRISSPNINTTGYTNLQLSFNFIGNGEANDDKAYLQYSINGGATWINATGAPTSANPGLPVGSSLNNLKSFICSPQGRWTNITWNLPATCENIPNLRVAFVWQNDNDANATDPSFAVDDIVISTLSPLPVELVQFDANTENNQNILTWTTQTEQNSDYFELEKSTDGYTFFTLDKIKAAGNSINTNFYSYIDYEINSVNTYYRLKQMDINGAYKYSDIKSIYRKPASSVYLSFNPDNSVSVVFNQDYHSNLSIMVNDVLGRNVYNKLLTYVNENHKIFINLPTQKNIYFVYVVDNQTQEIIFVKKIIH